MHSKICSRAVRRLYSVVVCLAFILVAVNLPAASPFEGYYRGTVKFRGQIGSSVVESNALWLTLSVDSSGTLVTETIGTPALQTTVRGLPYVFGVVNTDGSMVLGEGSPFTPGGFEPLPAPDTRISGSVMKITSRDNRSTAGGVTFSQQFTLLATNVGAIPSNAPPRINHIRPGSTNIVEGLTLAVLANTIFWTGPVTAQWRKDGVDLPGATNFFGFETAYMKAGITREDAGAYTVVLRNDFGAVTSAVMNITVSAPPPLTLGGTDPTFSPGSGPAYGLAGNVLSGQVNGVAPLPDGRVVVGGYWDRWNNQPNPGLARLNGDGALDTNFVAGLFHPVSPTNHAVSALALQEDGKLVVSWLGGMARLNVDGSADTTFSNAVTGVRQIIIQPDGKILVGNFAAGPQALGRMNTDGSWDRSFARGQDYFTGITRQIALQSDGKIVVFGRLLYRDGGGNDQVVSSTRVMRLNADGSLDSTFVPGVSPSDSDEAAMAAVGVQPDGRIVIGGAWGLFNRTYGGQTNVNGLLRLNANGSFDATFKAGDGVCTKFVIPGIPPIYSCGSVSTIYCQADGKIFIGGNFTTFNQTARTNFARLNSDGSLDTAFNPAASAPDADVQFIKPTLAGKFYLAGRFTKLGQVPRGSIGRIAGTTPPLPDLKAPVIVITSPKGATATTLSNQVTVTGTAIDDRELKRVQARLGDGAFADTTGTASWSANFELAPGTNVISIRATDATGNAATNRLVVVYRVSEQLHVNVNGAGLVTPAYDGTIQEIGRSLVLTAVPARGWVFSNWIVGAQTRLTSKATFVMESNLTIVANFVTNPFAASKAAFNGLVMDDAAPSHARAGFLSVNLLDTGKYTANLLFAGKKVAFAGAFDLSRQTVANLAPKPGTNTYLLRLALSEDGRAMAGTLADGEGEISVRLNKAAFGPTAPATNYVGSYTMLVQPAEGESIEIGDGYGLLKVDVAGTASLTGVLADGNPAVVKAGLSAEGAWPFYLPLYAGQGSLFGWLSVDRRAGNAVIATNGLLWTHPAQVKQPYAGGFTNRFVPLASRYVPPVGTNAALTFSSGVVILAGGNLPQDLTNAVSLGAGSKVTNLGSNKLVMGLVGPTGSMSGSMTPAGGSKPIPFKGVVLQGQNFGGGYFLGTNQTGPVYFGE